MRLQDAELRDPRLMRFDDHYDGPYVVCGLYIPDYDRAQRERVRRAEQAAREEARLRGYLTRRGLMVPGAGRGGAAAFGEAA